MTHRMKAYLRNEPIRHSCFTNTSTTDYRQPRHAPATPHSDCPARQRRPLALDLRRLRFHPDVTTTKRPRIRAGSTVVRSATGLPSARFALAARIALAACFALAARVALVARIALAARTALADRPGSCPILANSCPDPLKPRRDDGLLPRILPLSVGPLAAWAGRAVRRRTDHRPEPAARPSRGGNERQGDGTCP